MEMHSFLFTKLWSQIGHWFSVTFWVVKAGIPSTNPMATLLRNPWQPLQAALGLRLQQVSEDPRGGNATRSVVPPVLGGKLTGLCSKALAADWNPNYPPDENHFQEDQCKATISH